MKNAANRASLRTVSSFGICQGVVLAAPESVLCGWRGVIPLSLSLSLSLPVLPGIVSSLLVLLHCLQRF